MNRGGKPTSKGRILRVDPKATSAQPGEPAFAARPDRAPVYHGFPILEDVEVEGFKFGMITDFESQPDTCGDAFVVAPDGSRAGLDWEVLDGERFAEVVALEPERWGVWYVNFPYPMTSRENVRKNLAAIVPRLREKWQEWRRRFPQGEQAV